MAKITGKIKSFEVRTQRICKNCTGVAKPLGGEYYQCPTCGNVHYKRTKRRWFAIGSIDVFERDFRATFSETAVSELLERINVSWSHSMDRLKGLKGTAWFETWKDIKQGIDNKAESELVDQAFLFYGKQYGENSIEVKKISGLAGNSREANIGERFVEGSVQELTEIAEKVLPEYETEVELWVEIPVVYFIRNLQGIHIVIGLRAPVGIYGKSYKIWMRANNMHMYPSRPKKVKNDLEWVYSFNHTAGWKDKLRKNLEYCKSMESQLVKVVKAAEKLPANSVEKLIKNLSAEVIGAIEEKWHGGTLWQLVETTGKIDRAAGITILKNAGFLTDEGLPPV